MVNFMPRKTQKEVMQHCPDEPYCDCPCEECIYFDGNHCGCTNWTPEEYPDALFNCNKRDKCLEDDWDKDEDIFYRRDFDCWGDEYED